MLPDCILQRLYVPVIFPVVGVDRIKKRITPDKPVVVEIIFIKPLELVVHTVLLRLMVSHVDGKRNPFERGRTFIAQRRALSYVAQNERDNIRKRQAEGIAAARERGGHFGNPGKQLPETFEEVVRRWRSREIGLAQALEELEIGRTCFYKYVKQLGLCNTRSTTKVPVRSLPLFLVSRRGMSRTTMSTCLSRVRIRHCSRISS